MLSSELCEHGLNRHSCEICLKIAHLWTNETLGGKIKKWFEGPNKFPEKIMKEEDLPGRKIINPIKSPLPRFKKESFEKVLEGKILVDYERSVMPLKEIGVDIDSMRKITSPADFDDKFKKELKL